MLWPAPRRSPRVPDHDPPEPEVPPTCAGCGAICLDEDLELCDRCDDAYLCKDCLEEHRCEPEPVEEVDP